MGFRCTLAACAAMMLAVPAAAAADPAVTTGDVTGITATSATVHGVIDTSVSNSAWTFRYGTSTAYGSATKAQVVAPGLSFVVARLEGLKPDTTYHYQLFLAQGGPPPAFDAGLDRTFHTLPAVKPPSFGQLSLLLSDLTLSDGKVAIPVSCTGRHGSICRGVVSVTAIAVQHGQPHPVACGTASLRLTAPRGVVLHATPSPSCAQLVGSTRQHRVRAVLNAVFTSAQQPLSDPVTLSG